MGFPLILSPKKALFFDFDKIFTFENSYSSETVNKDNLANEPSFKLISSILKTSFPLVSISIVFSRGKIVSSDPKKDSNPIVPNLEFSISVFLFSTSIGV